MNCTKYLPGGETQIDLHEEMDKAFKDIVEADSKRDKKATVVGSDVHKEESKRLFGDKGHKFYDAEDYHQEYESNHPENPYVQSVSIPRLRAFQNKFPELLKESEKH